MEDPTWIEFLDALKKLGVVPERSGTGVPYLRRTLPDGRQTRPVVFGAKIEDAHRPVHPNVRRTLLDRLEISDEEFEAI